MDSRALPPPMNCAPELCFCGRKTVEFHDFWFCSTECARLDALLSLDNPECHYRRVVQAYVRTGGTDSQPRRMMSAGHLSPGPSEQRGFANLPPSLTPQKNQPHQADGPFASRTARDRNVAGFPTLSQLTSKVLTRKATAGEPLAAERQDRTRLGAFPDVLSRACPPQRPGNRTLQQISLDAIPLPEHVPARTLRRVPSSVDGLRNNAKKASVTALVNFGRTRKVKEGDNPEGIFSHPVNHVVPLVGKEFLPLHHQMGHASAVPMQTTKALRRSASFAGWNATAHIARGPADEQDSLMRIIEEMREEMSSEGFDPKSLFEQEEDY